MRRIIQESNELIEISRAHMTSLAQINTDQCHCSSSSHLTHSHSTVHSLPTLVRFASLCATGRTCVVVK